MFAFPSFRSLQSLPSLVPLRSARNLYTSKSKGVITPRPLQQPVETPDLSKLPPPLPVNELPYRVRRTKLGTASTIPANPTNEQSKMATNLHSVQKRTVASIDHCATGWWQCRGMFLFSKPNSKATQARCLGGHSTRTDKSSPSHS